MGLRILTMLALSALACASVMDTQRGNETQIADCYWDGTAPFCAGSCPGGYEECGTSSCGDGACCWTGYKKYCCLGKCPEREVLAIEFAKAALAHNEIAPVPEIGDSEEVPEDNGTSEEQE
ncbi:hypothetical protein GGR51DRAFT_560671 [Nemania sp. FL0031]|nr:hypothetical protein GGR51DRAFT_560671 [Nemania sp. FL0031]